MGTGFFDHLVDVVSRRPNGFVGRTLHRRPMGHMAGFKLALARLPLQVKDRMLEVACGGGAFVNMALKSGCSVYAVDYSKDMVNETVRQNSQAVAEERLSVAIANADDIPFANDAFTKLFCFNAFFFFQNPAKVMAEMARVLAPGGKLAILTSSPAAARFSFGPLASRMRFDTPEQMTQWAEAAGLTLCRSHDANAGNFLFLAKKPHKASH